MNNQGSIYGAADGVLALGGSVNNTGLITSSHDGLVLTAAGQVSNTSTIESTGGTFTFRGMTAVSSGVVLLEGGSITNTSTGLISGQDGIVIEGSAGSTGDISNAGSVIGTLIGVAATAFTSIDNSGLIEGTSATLVTFAGEIFAGIGVSLLDGGAVTNQSSGTIAGPEFGIAFATYAPLPTNITNSGLIEGTGSTFVTAGGTFGSDGVFFIDGGTLTNQSTGTIIGYAAGIESFTHLTGGGADTLSAGQTLADYGALTIEGSFLNDGLVVTDPSTIIFTGDVSGTGSILIGHDSNIVFDGSVSSSETIVFADNTGTITINDPAGFHATVIGNGTTLVPCFAAGTRILTPQGDVVVENLEVGDIVITSEGEDVPIQWIGRRTIDLTRHPSPKKARPICFDYECFGTNAPGRDLYLSPDHGLFIDGKLIPAKALVNGMNVR